MIMTPTILIVEDHDLLRASLSDWLAAALNPCTITTATDGLAAIEAAQTQQPHLVLMDLDLPRLNGLEATRRIKAALPDTQVVMLTVYEDQAHRADATAAGASAYVPKRTLSSDLVPVVNTLLQKIT
jgi:DNA-binding NarL/FixJ family response regulator